MPSNLTEFGLAEMLRCSREMHRAASGAPTMEECARRLCRWLYDELVASDGARACSLIRCYKTHPFGSLPSPLQRFAQRAGGMFFRETARMKCVTLRATCV